MTKISNFGKQNSILGSVVPLAMFSGVRPLVFVGNDQQNDIYRQTCPNLLERDRDVDY